MHGKAQREPARHSVVPDCKLVHIIRVNICLPSVIQSPCSKAGSVAQCENLGSVGGQKLANRSQPFLDQSSPNLEECRTVPVDLQVSF